MAAYEGSLSISERAQGYMDDLGFTEADIRETIGAAEETGEYLRNEDGSVILAKLKIDETYIYVQCTKADGGFAVDLAYALKTWVEGW